jgi:DNA end-binding protein Ku
MAPRPYWKGHIRLSLVSFPVQLHSATSTGGRVQFHQIHRESGRRVRHQKVVPDVGPIENDDIVKGFEVEKDHYVIVEADELDALKVESKHTIDLVQFVGGHEVDPLYFEKPYFVVPDGEMAQEAYRVIHKALRDSCKMALGQVVLSGREHLVAIRPCGRGMLLETLRSADEVKKGSPYFAEIEEGQVDEDQLGLAAELIKRKTAPFDPRKFTDHYEAALRELIKAKVEDRKVRIEPEAEPAGVVIDLMQALKKSLEGEKAGATAKKPGKGKTAEVRRLPTRKEPAKEPAKTSAKTQERPRRKSA